MSFKMVFRSLQEVFPQVDLRILKAVAMEHSKDVDAAVDFILYEVLPLLNEPTEGSYNITDSHARENSPVQRVQDTFWDNKGAEGENANLLPVPGLERNCASLHPNVQGMYGTEVLPNETAVCTPAQNFPSSLESMNFLIEHEGPVTRGLSKSDGILAFNNLEINNSRPDAVTTAQDILSSVSGNTSNMECGLDKVNQSFLIDFEEQNSRGIFENCSGSVAVETDMNFLIEFEEPVARGLSKSDKSDGILAFSNLEINNSRPDAVTSAQDMPSVSGDASNMECGVDKVNQSSLSDFEEQNSRGIYDNCSESVAVETEMSSVAEKPTVVGTQLQYEVGMDILEDILSDVKTNKETLVIAFESVNNMMKVVELHGDKAKQAKEEASKAGHEILTKAEDMKQMLIHAKEAKEKQAAEVDAEKSLLATKAQELQSHILHLSDQRERFLSIIEEIHQTLETRLAAAKEVQTAAEQEKLEREEVAHKILNEQEVIMEEIVQESKRLQQESQENAKLREFLMDRGRIVDILQREMAVICEDLMLIKERVNGHVRLSKSPLLSNGSLTSSSSSSSSLRSLSEGSLHTVALGGSPKTTTGEPPINKQPENDSNENTGIGVGDRGNKESSDDDWELLLQE